MKIGSPPEGACSDTESDIRALRQQFGVPSQGSCVTLVYGLYGTKQSRRLSSRRRIHFHGFGVAQQGHGTLLKKLLLARSVVHKRPETRQSHLKNGVFSPLTGGRRERE